MSNLKDVGPTVFRYHLLPFCNLDTLLRLNWVCRAFRSSLNDPDTITDWCHLCSWLQPRHCCCERRQFLLEVETWCPFMWDYRGETPETDDGCVNLRQMQMVLRRYGRSVPMMIQSLARPFRMPLLPLPKVHCACMFDVAGNGSLFCPGMYSDLVGSLLIPMPRMLPVPVEQAQVDRVERILTGETHREDPYWGLFHEVTDEMLEDNERIKWDKREVPPCVKDREYPDAEFSTDVTDYVDRVQAYVERCAREDRNPWDPNEDDDDMSGYQAEQWARRLLYESAVGLQTFPLLLCVHVDDLCGLAHRLGPVYLERFFLSAQSYEGSGGEAEILGRQGEVLMYNVRYDNQAGDFVSWCLATMGKLNAVYHHLWHDYVRMWLRSFRVYCLNLAAEIQQDLPMSELAPLWQRLVRQLFLHQPFVANIQRPDVVHPGDHTPLSHREKRALDFLMDSAYRNEFLEVQRRVEEWQHRPLTQSRMFREPYLCGVVPEEHWNSPSYPEHALALDVEHLLNVSEFLLGLGERLGPRVDTNTACVRRRMHRLYLNSGLSIILWAPHWQRPFPDGWRHIHCDPTTEVPLRLLNLNPQNNHRYVDYLHFLNQRVMFHHPHPDAWFTERTFRVDVGRTLRA